jgi:hypothetical protein
MSKQTKKQKEQVVEVEQEEVVPVANGKAVGVYYDEKTKNYVLVTLELYPEEGFGNIITKKMLTSSRPAAIMNGEITLQQVLDKNLKK